MYERIQQTLLAAAMIGLMAPVGCQRDGVYSGTVVDDFADKLRDCGLLTEGRVGGFEEPGDPIAQCYYDCYNSASCADLESLICDSSEPSPGTMVCLESCETHNAFVCADGSDTISGEWFCDGYADCADGSDEVGCTAPTQFHCADGSDTIPMDWQCDGEPDCIDGSDEVGCTAPTQFHCADGSDTIPMNWQCDGESDCVDGSDETGCAELICPGGSSGGGTSGSSDSGSSDSN